MFGGDWTSTVTATDCFPTGSRSAGRPSSRRSPAALGPSVAAGSGRRRPRVGGPLGAGQAGVFRRTGRDRRPAGMALPTAGASGRRPGRDLAVAFLGSRPPVGPASGRRLAASDRPSPGSSSGFGTGSSDGPRRGLRARRSAAVLAAHAGGVPAAPTAKSPGSARIAGPWIGPLLGNGPGDSASRTRIGFSTPDQTGRPRTPPAAFAQSGANRAGRQARRGVDNRSGRIEKGQCRGNRTTRRARPAVGRPRVVPPPSGG